VPLLQRKGQVQLSGHTSFGRYEGVAAIAIINHIAVLGNDANLGAAKDNNNIFTK